jgi:hypothetical protein
MLRRHFFAAFVLLLVLSGSVQQVAIGQVRRSSSGSTFARCPDGYVRSANRLCNRASSVDCESLVWQNAADREISSIASAKRYCGRDRILDASFQCRGMTQVELNQLRNQCASTRFPDWLEPRTPGSGDGQTATRWSCRPGFTGDPCRRFSRRQCEERVFQMAVTPENMTFSGSRAKCGADKIVDHTGNCRSYSSAEKYNLATQCVELH